MNIWLKINSLFFYYLYNLFDSIDSDGQVSEVTLRYKAGWGKSEKRIKHKQYEKRT